MRKAVSVPQYSPRQAYRQIQPVGMLSGLPVQELAAQVAVTPRSVATTSSPRGPAPREIDTDFEVTALRHQMASMEGLVEDLRQEIVSLQTNLSVDKQIQNSDEAPLAMEKVGANGELRHETGDQPQEFVEIQRLRHIIEDQGAEIQELRVKTAELTASNKELEARRAELERILEANAQVDCQASQPIEDAEQVGQTTVSAEQIVENGVAQDVEDFVQDDFLDEAAEIEKVQTPPSSGRKMRPLRGDAIDLLIKDYLDSCPDFRLAVEKIKPGWYIFGEPISKKLYLKMAGEHVVCRVGGGTKELTKYLDEFRFCIPDKKDQELARARVKRLSLR